MPDKQSVAKNLATALTEWTEVLSAGNPLLLAGIEISKKLAEWARREQIDPGPFEVIIASGKAKVIAGIDDDIAYRERHPDAAPATPLPPGT